MSTICKPVCEMILWNNCSNHGACAFCWQQGKKNPFKFLEDKKKLDSINKARLFIADHFIPSGEWLEDDFIIKNPDMTGNHLLFVGGELFDIDNLEVNNQLDELLGRIVWAMEKNYIDLFYINTNLIYESSWVLDNLLSRIVDTGLHERLRFTTSWDAEGRFNTPEKKQLFLSNLTRIRQEYPDIQIVVNMILTKPLCEHILNENENFVRDFQNFYGVRVNTIPYIVLTEHLAPTKEMVLKTLLALDRSMAGYLEEYVRNFSLDQAKEIYEYNSKDDGYVYTSADHSECGHYENFRKYCSDSDTCFICDIQKLLEMAD